VLAYSVDEARSAENRFQSYWIKIQTSCQRLIVESECAMHGCNTLKRRPFQSIILVFRPGLFTNGVHARQEPLLHLT
jgi:hypothetical protein